MCANPINLDYDKKYAPYITRNDWNKLTDRQRAEAVRQIEQKLAEEINKTETPSTPAGTTVESKNKKYKSEGIPLSEDKELQNLKLQDYKREMLIKYGQNPDLCKKDTAEILYRKELKEIESGIRNLDSPADPDKRAFSVLVREKYFELASKEEREQLAKEEVELLAQYKQDENSARKDYNSEFSRVNRNYMKKPNEQMTEDELKRLAHRKALYKHSIGEPEYRKMAVEILSQKYDIQLSTRYDQYTQERSKVFGLTAEDKVAYQALMDKEQKGEKLTEQEAKKRDKLANLVNYEKIDETRKAELLKLNHDRVTSSLTDTEYNKKFEKINNDYYNALQKASIPAKKREASDKEFAALEAQKSKLTEEQYQRKLNKIYSKYSDVNSIEISQIKRLDKKMFGEIDEVNKTKFEEADKTAELIAQAKVDAEIAKEKFDKTVVHWSHDDKVDDSDGKIHNYLDKDLQKYVKERAEMFADEVEAGKGDFEADGKSYKFNSDKYKQVMLNYSNLNEYIDNPNDNADYFADIQDKKDLFFDDYAYGENYKITAADRRFADKAIRTASIDTEHDKTASMRAGVVGLAFLEGAGIAGAGALVGQALAMTNISKIPPEILQFSGVVHVAGEVAYNKMVHYQQDIHLSGDNATYGKDITVEGDDATYTQNVVVEGDDATYTQNVVVEGNDATYGKNVVVEGNDATYGKNVVVEGNDGTYNQKIVVEGDDATYGQKIVVEGNDAIYGKTVIVQGDDGTYEQRIVVSGEAPYHASGTVSVDDIVNGHVKGTIDAPWEADGTTPYEQEVLVQGNDAHYNKEVWVQGNDGQYRKEVWVEGNDGHYHKEVVVQGNDAHYNKEVWVEGNDGYYHKEVWVQGNDGYYRQEVVVQGNDGHYRKEVMVKGNDGHYHKEVHVQGDDGHWEYEGTVEGDVEVNDMVPYETDAEYNGEVATEEKRVRPSINWKAIGWAALAGGVTAAFEAAVNKVPHVFDEGDRVYSRAREKAADLQAERVTLKDKPVQDNSIKDFEDDIKMPERTASLKDVSTSETINQNTYKIKKGDYPYGIVEAAYNISQSDPAFMQVANEVFKASGYTRGTHIKVGQEFILPDEIKVGDKTFRSKKGDEIDTQKDYADLKNIKFSTLNVPTSVTRTSEGWQVIDDKGNPIDNKTYPTKEAAETAMTKWLSKHNYNPRPLSGFVDPKNPNKK